MSFSNPLVYVAIVSIIGVIFGIGTWVGAVNTDRKSFKAFMTEVRNDLKKILSRLPPRSVRRRNFSWDSTPHFAQIHANLWDTATDSRHFGRTSVYAPPPTTFRSVLRRTLLACSQAKAPLN